MLYQDWDIELSGERIRITPMQRQDDEAYVRLMFGDLYDTFLKSERSAENEIRDILNHTESEETHALRPIGSDAFIGWIALQRDHERCPDIGIHIQPEYQNKGLGPEAVTLFANRLRECYDLSRVYVRIFESNLQSQRAFSKLGAILDYTEPHPGIAELYRQVPGCTQEDVPLVHYYHIDLPIINDSFSEDRASCSVERT